MMDEKELKERYYNGYLQGVVDFLNIMITTYGDDVKSIPFSLSKANEITLSLQDRIEKTWDRGYMYFNEETDQFEYAER